MPDLDIVDSNAEKSLLIIDLWATGLLCVSGPDAKKLLQGQLTCDLEEISESRTSLGAYCLPQGRMVSLFRIFLFQDSYYLQMPAAILQSTMDTLKKYAVFFKAQIRDASEELVCLSVSGVTVSAKLSASGLQIPAAVNQAITQQNLLIIRLPGELPHFEIIGTAAAITLLRETLSNVRNGDYNDWELLNIMAGIPALTADTAGKLLPHDVNLPQANGISWNKGCYTGQEIIARMHYRGQLKKQMFRGRVQTGNPPLPGADIYTAENAAGTLVSTSLEAPDQYQILFLANIADAENGQLFLNPAKIDPIALLTLTY
jgi:folate-binding protein YgfZ